MRRLHCSHKGPREAERCSSPPKVKVEVALGKVETVTVTVKKRGGSIEVAGRTTVLGVLGRREGHHCHSEFKYRSGLLDQLGDLVEGYPCAHSERGVWRGESGDRRGRSCGSLFWPFCSFIVCWLIDHVHDLYKQERLEGLKRRGENPVLLDDMESEVHDQLVEMFGDTFAAKIARDGGWARMLLAKAQVAG